QVAVGRTVLFNGSRAALPAARAAFPALEVVMVTAPASVLAARLAALAQGRTLVWLVGNHDADGPQRLPGEVADALDLGPLILRHEPEPGLQLGELSGHLHPCARVTSGRGTVRRRCFATDGSRMILPAFGAYAGGLNLRGPAFAGLFARTPLAGGLALADARLGYNCGGRPIAAGRSQRPASPRSGRSGPRRSRRATAAHWRRRRASAPAPPSPP
ncbi:MAG TPA: hypothetical protein PKB04_00130, partial [Phenylobacterium sp.]|nr:hypothetical protein [Phenylobacterium sp.]